MDKPTTQQLQDAARAAGYEYLGEFHTPGVRYIQGENCPIKWNPTTDLADAFRLISDFMIKHGIAAHFHYDQRTSEWSAWCSEWRKDFVSKADTLEIAWFNLASAIGSQMRTGE